jgi:nucleoside 2-deoxyribosyltransferase
MKDSIDGRDIVRLLCPRCGQYNASGSAYATLGHKELTPRQTANASGWVREHQGVELSTTDLDFLLSLRNPAVNERAAKVLVALDKKLPEIGAEVNFNFRDPNIAEWIAISWSSNAAEVQYLFVEVLLAHGFIAGHASQEMSLLRDLVRVHITPVGYEQLEKMRRGGSSSAIGFCAMWFSPKLMPVWNEAIEPAIRDAGYDPLRIDRIEHNNKIDDEIVAAIRRSRFVVADFTGNRGGVYFEAGFAMGRDIPVIWTIRSGRFHRVHFDNRQYNFVDWSFEDLPGFRNRLQNRIEATIGQGPMSKIS